MADLTNRQGDLPIGIVGLTTLGVPETPVGSDTNGNLLVNINAPIASGTNTIGATNQGLANTLANSWPHKLSDGTNGPVAVKPASTAPLATDPALVVTLSPNSSPQPYSTGSGTIAALNGSVIATAGGSVIFNISGTWVGTISSEANNGDGTWINVAALSNQSGLVTNTVTINGSLEINVAGWVQVRLIATAWTSGTATITWSSTAGSHVIIPYSPNGVNFNTYTTLTDPNQNPLGYTAASTAATATQEALVVALSPNSPLPTGTNTLGTVFAKLEDGGGNAIASINSELLVSDIINTSSQYRAQSVTTTAAEALGGATILSNRKVLTITPTNGTIYWGTSNAVTTTTGTPLFPNQMLTLSFTNSVHVYVIAATTVDTRIMEAG